MIAPIPNAAKLRSRLDRVIGYRDSLVQRESRVRSEIKNTEAEEYTLGLAVSLLRTMADAEVNDSVEAIETLQTEAMRAVFPDQDNQVKAEVKVSRGKVSVELLNTRKNEDGSEITGSTLDAFGGALTSVQSVLLRITVMLRRGQRPFLVLDESLPAISKEYVTRMAEFLSLLCERLGMDILVITHDELLIDHADRAYRVVQKDGRTKFLLQ